MTVETIVRSLMADGTLVLGDPGGGHTAERHMVLFDIARRYPVSVARLVEAHTDAVSILHEAERHAEDGLLYGVWASAGPSSGAQISSSENQSGSGLAISGTKPFASGRGLLDRALVTAADTRPGTERADPSEGDLLVDVDLRGRGHHHEASPWTTAALSGSATGAVSFTQQPIDVGDIIAPAGWYLDRVGFWHGACGPAACWAGAAAGLVDVAETLADDDPHRRAHLGALRSCLWMFEALLVAAGDQIDRSAGDVVLARSRAMSLRHRVERGVAEVLDRFGQAFGPRPFVSDEQANQRFLDTHLYARQHHGERDMAVLGAGDSPFARRDEHLSDGRRV